MKHKHIAYRYLRFASTTSLAGVALACAVFNDAPRRQAAISNVSFAAEAAPAAALQTLLDVPAGQDAAFYRERLSQIQAECQRLGIDFEKAARRTRPSDAPYRDADKKIAEVAQSALRAVADASEFPRAERDAAFLRLLELRKAQYVSPSGESATLYRPGTPDFFSDLLAAEEAKTPIDVGRVLELRRRLADLPSFRPFSNKEGGNFIATASDYPSGVQASYARQLLETPENESGEFYLSRYDELRCAARVSFLGELASKEEIRERKRNVIENELREKLRAEADKIAVRLAFADDLKPATRLEFFAAYVDKFVQAGDVEKLRDLYDRESVRDARNPFDAVRAPLVDLAILRARLVRLDAEPDEQEAFALASDVAERADDGEIAWEVGGHWAQEAANFVRRLEESTYEAARRLQEDVLAALADSEDATVNKVREELARPVVEFDFSLLDIPEGESGAFYEERLTALKRAYAGKIGFGEFNFDAALFNLSRYRLPNGAWSDPRPASPNSFENRVYVAARFLYERLFDAPDLSPKVRDGYFREYLRDAYLLYRVEGGDVQSWRDFLAKRLALEETREPFPLARVLVLRSELKKADARLASKKTLDDFPRLVSFIDALLADEEANIAAALETIVSGKTANDQLQGFLQLCDLRERLRAQKRPAEENDAFYLERWQELQSAALASNQTGINVSLSLVEDFLSGKLAFADDIDPIERFAAFQSRVDAIVGEAGGDAGQPNGIERLTALLEQETKREAKHPADAARVPYIRARLLAERAQTVLAGRKERLQPTLDPNAAPETSPLSEEERAELERFAAEALERVDDGPLAWKLGENWSTLANSLTCKIDQIDLAFATQLRKDLLARLADSENEVDRDACEAFANGIDLAAFIGSKPQVVGALLPDGKPLDWASYRGAPVLVEIFTDAAPGYFSWNSNPPVKKESFFQECIGAGLKVVRFGSGTSEEVRRHYAATRGGVFAAGYYGSGWPVAHSLEDRKDRRIDWLKWRIPTHFNRVWILFDADGAVVATEPELSNPIYRGNAPTVEEALKTFFPNVSTK